MKMGLTMAAAFLLLIITSCAKDTKGTKENKETKQTKESKVAPETKDTKGSKKTASLSGNWIGHIKFDDATEDAYFELTQEGMKITGKACEEPGGVCYEILDGKVDGSKLTFHCKSEENGEKHQMTWDLILGDDGQLKGSSRTSFSESLAKVSMKRYTK
jgi:hypothetical protein